MRGGRTLNEIIYPIGSVIIRVDSANPSQWYGGTWELLCPGRTLVCINTDDSDFNIVKKVGGEKKHILNVNEIPTHNHTVSNNGNVNLPITINATDNAGTGYKIQYKYGSSFSPRLIADNTGGGQAHNNLQPYMVVYIWVRVS